MKTIEEIAANTQTKSQILTSLANVQSADATIKRIGDNKVKFTASLKAFVAGPESADILGADFDAVKAAVDALV